MSDAPRYMIRTVADFQQVPDDRLDACLAEFAVCVRSQREAKGLITEVAMELGTSKGTVGWVGDFFEWIDDGARNITINIRAGGESAAP